MSYTPNETATQLIAEQAWLAGALITGAGYGIVLALFLLCFNSLWIRLRHRDASHRRNLVFLVYVCVLFAFGSLFLGSNSYFTQLAFINNRGFPGGPSQYEKQMFSIRADEISNVSYVLSNWLTDALLIWRCVIIYRDFGALPARIVLIVTCLMQLMSIALGILFLIQVSSPSSSPFHNAGHPINWTSPYFGVSLGINIIVTILIIIRLLLYRRTMVQLPGPGYATERTTVIAVLIESAAIYATFSLLFLVPFALNAPLSYTFLQVLGEAQLIAPLLIIHREAEGKGWISIASSATSSIVTNSRDIRIPRFSDIQFATEMSYSHSGGTRTFQSKQDSFGRVLDVGDVERDEIELREF